MLGDAGQGGAWHSAGGDFSRKGIGRYIFQISYWHLLTCLHCSSSPGVSHFVSPSFFSMFVSCPPRILLVSLLYMECSTPKRLGTKCLEDTENWPYERGKSLDPLLSSSPIRAKNGPILWITPPIGDQRRHTDKVHLSWKTSVTRPFSPLTLMPSIAALFKETLSSSKSRLGQSRENRMEKGRRTGFKDHPHPHKSY